MIKLCKSICNIENPEISFVSLFVCISSNHSVCCSIHFRVKQVYSHVQQDLAFLPSGASVIFFRFCWSSLSSVFICIFLYWWLLVLFFLPGHPIFRYMMKCCKKIIGGTVFKESFNIDRKEIMYLLKYKCLIRIRNIYADTKKYIKQQY